MSDFKTIKDSYRPIPFWSWNEKLTLEETRRQIEMMKEKGIGGYFMHARGGLQTEYLSEEWFENIKEGIDCAKELQMSAWVYDENGWPSGFGNGKVNGRGLKYQQKYLRMEKDERGEKYSDYTICHLDGYHFYYEVNPYYVDTLDKEVTRVFIDEIYDPYYARFADSFAGIFTDEPQVSRNGIPWSFILEEEYRKAYSEELLEDLVSLFLPVGEYKKIRFQFWKLVTDLFTHNYMKQIQDWCRDRNLKFTGHVVLEESLEGQLTSHGACMPNYEFFDMPGMDWLGRNEYSNLAQIQLCSVAHQLGKKEILTETYAMCGHNVSFEELKGILEWQMVRGVNVYCSHLQGYSLRGIRKRDYPPAMYYQQPWWEEYRIFVDAMARTGMILGEGEINYDTLLIHPQSLAWTMFNDNDNQGISKLQQQLTQVINLLDEKHIQFHLGDETIIERHGSVEGNQLVIGTQKYRHVILLNDEVLFEHTRKLLNQYQENNGELTVIFDTYNNQSKQMGYNKDEETVIQSALSILPFNDIINHNKITYTSRNYPDCIVHYFVNTTQEEIQAYIKRGNQYIDAITGELHDFDGYHTFEPRGSLLVVETQKDQSLVEGEWQIEDMTDNALLLDFCDYYFDGVLEEENGYVLNIQNRACNRKKPVSIRQVYKLTADYVPEQLYLGCETPEIYSIFINGQRVEHKDCGYFMDQSIRRLDISGMLDEGDNILELNTHFWQPDDVYENLEKAMIFESEKNKITYQVEIEPIYIIGDFSVKTEGDYREVERKAAKYRGPFVLSHPKTSLQLSHMEQQGYPFFCGTMVLSKNFCFSGWGRYQLVLKKQGFNVIKVNINHGEEKTLLWGDKILDITDQLKKGENILQLTLRNNLRNLMGPHHLKEGESYGVGPNAFFKEPCIWSMNADKQWDSDYCLVETGVEVCIL